MVKSVTEKQPDTRHPVIPVLLGIVGAFILSLLLLVLFSALLTINNMPAGTVTPFACISIGGGAFCGGFVTARLMRSRGLLYGGITGILFFLILYLMGLIMRQADLNAMFVIKVAVSVVFGSIGGIMGVNFRRKRSRI